MRSGSTNASTVANWLGRLFRLDFSVLAEVRANPSATSAAVVIVLVASLFAGLGSWLWALQSFVDDRDAFIRSFIVGSLLQTVVWFSWVYVAYYVLTQGYHARQDFGEMTRAMGFAFAGAVACFGRALWPDQLRHRDTVHQRSDPAGL